MSRTLDRQKPFKGAGWVLPLLALCVLVATLFLGVVTLVRTAAGSSSTLDFSAFYTAGQLVSEDLGSHLYDIEIQEIVQRDISGDNYDKPLPFAAPAFVAFAFAPLTSLSLRGAFGVMLVVNLAMLGAVLLMLRKSMPDVPGRTRNLALAVTAFAIPAISVITAGQIDLLVTAALLGGMLLLRADRPVAAGLVLALAFAKPQLALGVPILLLATRDWRPLATMLAVGVVLALAPTIALGTHALTGNLDALDAVGRPALMANWRGFLASAGAPDDVWLWAPGWAAIAGVAVFCSWRVWRRDTSTLDQKWALVFLLPLLASPHLHGQSLVLALPAVALFLQSESWNLRGQTSDGRAAWERRAETLLLALFVLLFARWVVALAGVSLSVFFLAVLFVAIALPERWRLLPQADAASTELRAA